MLLMKGWPAWYPRTWLSAVRHDGVYMHCYARTFGSSRYEPGHQTASSIALTYIQLKWRMPMTVILMVHGAAGKGSDAKQGLWFMIQVTDLLNARETRVKQVASVIRSAFLPTWSPYALALLPWGANTVICVAQYCIAASIVFAMTMTGFLWIWYVLSIIVDYLCVCGWGHISGSHGPHTTHTYFR